MQSISGQLKRRNRRSRTLSRTTPCQWAKGDNGSEDEEVDDEGQGLACGAGVCKAEDVEDLGGLAPAHQLNKATILCNATEYIMHLERRNRNLAKENAALRSRVEGFEMLVMSRGGPAGMGSQLGRCSGCVNLLVCFFG